MSLLQEIRLYSVQHSSMKVHNGQTLEKTLALIELLF